MHNVYSGQVWRVEDKPRVHWKAVAGDVTANVAVGS